MSVSSTQTQATAHPCSHDADDVGEEGRDGYPLDLETTLQKKLLVAESENRDQTEQMSDSEMPCPISSRTRSRIKKKRRAAVHRDDSADVPDDDGDVERPEDIRAGATVHVWNIVRCLEPSTQEAHRKS